MIYLDASVVVAALTNEPRSSVVRAWLAGKDDNGLAVSHWTRVEVASALSIKARRSELSAEQQRSAMDVLDVLANGVTNWMIAAPIVADFELAEQLSGQAKLNLRGGDALHLAIAHRHDWVLATLDKAMRNAAERAGIILEPELID